MEKGRTKKKDAKRGREEEEEEKETVTVKRRCVGSASVEAFEIFSQGGRSGELR